MEGRLVLICAVRRGMVTVDEKWGSWEELLLGGAVLRHGTRAWDAVASELRARTHYPYSFTPEVCKAKYEYLQQRYSDCKALFEELRKHRVAELKQALEKSDDSIGSLESKLESLKAEKGETRHSNYSSSQTESATPFQKSEGLECSGHDTSRDIVSAGSFTTQTNWSLENQILPEVKPELLDSSEPDKTPSIESVFGGQGVSIKRKRGKRKRKDCSRDLKEGSIEENRFLGSSNFGVGARCHGDASDKCDKNGRYSGVDECVGRSSEERSDFLMGIFDSVLRNENASIFHHHLDSQRKQRYKKTIRRHIDLDTIRSKISNHSITSTKALFRDLMLLITNAVVFYPKNSKEHKAALVLGDVSRTAFQKHLNDDSCNKTAAANTSNSKSPTMPTVKQRDIRRKLSENKATGGTQKGGKKASYGESLSVDGSSRMTKKRVGRPVKVARRSGKGAETPEKGRKRGRGT